MSNGREQCIICGIDADCIFITADKYDYRCENCGKYIFLNGIHRSGYEGLSEEEKERISNYISEFNEATGEWAEFGDITILWRQIEDFNRSRR